MTSRQRELLIIMRENGATYRECAIRLGIPVETVKSYYRRHHYTPKDKPKTCPQCGIPIVGAAKNKRFCSLECKTSWRNAHHDLYRCTSAVLSKCQHCGKEFRSYPKQARKYCSHDCYIEVRYWTGVHE